MLRFGLLDRNTDGNECVALMSNVADFVDRKHKDAPTYEIEAWITGVKHPDGKVHWKVHITGEDDPDLAAGILERAAEVLRDKDCETIATSA